MADQDTFDVVSSGDWSAAADWSDGAPPATSQDALVGEAVGGGDFDATSGANVTVNSISIFRDGTLEIVDDSVFTATNGTSLSSSDTTGGLGRNQGVIHVDVDSTLAIGDAFDNTGVLTIGLGADGGIGILDLDTAVTLSGAGTVILGQQGVSLNSGVGEIEGGGLVNVDDKIIGEGEITVDSFDNQAGGVVEADVLLEIGAASFSNEGQIIVDGNSLVDFGVFAAVSSLDNAGSIVLETGAAMLIFGNFTLAGAGVLTMAGTETRIDDKFSPTTLTNESTIKAVNSGALGSAGDFLSFVNTGLIEASGAGDLTVDTAAFDDGGGTLEADDGGELEIDSDVDTGVLSVVGRTASAGKIEAGPGGKVVLAAAVMDGIASNRRSVSGQILIDGGTFEMLSGASDTVPIEFAGADGTLRLDNVLMTIGSILGFGVADTVEFASVAYATGDFVSYVGNGSGTGGTVEVENSSGATGLSFVVQGAYSPSQFALVDDAGDVAVVGVAASAPEVASDFNGDGKTDILWRNADGDAEIWNSNSSGGFAGVDIGIVPTSWQIAELGDFNGDGKADILWRNTDGDTEVWNSNGSGGFTGVDLAVVPTSWQIVGTGDFNGDGKADILWRNTDGDTEVWNSNGSGGFTGVDLAVVTTSWQIVGTSDFNGDGKADILWRKTNGDTEVWDSNGSGGFTGVDFGIVPTNWQIAGTGDFNGDGMADILWRNTSGEAEVWDSNGSGGFAGVDFGIVPTNWQIAGTGDFNGDGKADILWRNANGDTEVWNSNGSGGFTGLDLGVVSSSWKTQA